MALLRNVIRNIREKLGRIGFSHVELFIGIFVVSYNEILLTLTLIICQLWSVKHFSDNTHEIV